MLNFGKKFLVSSLTINKMHLVGFSKGTDAL